MATKTGRPGLALLLLALFAAVQGALLLAPGFIVITSMEADALHLLDGVARLRLGQTPHIDFETPLGALALHAVAMWNAPPGRSIALANLLVAALCVPLAVWLAATRLSFAAALGLGMAAMAAAAAMTWSAESSGLSPAMGYNRWCWAAAMLTLPILLAPPRSGADAKPGAGRAVDWGDGLILGLIGAALAFTKISYVAALGPVWLVWALSSGRWRAAAVSLGAAIAALAGMALLIGGAEVVAAYLQDLWTVSTSSLRPQPGKPPVAIMTSPRNAPITLIVVVSALALARAGLRREGLLFALGAASVYAIAWQNFGNHPTGMIALPFVLVALAPRARADARAFGLPAAAVLRAMAIALFAISLPWALNAERSLFGAWGGQKDRSAVLAGAAPDILWDDKPGDLNGIIRLGETDEDARDFAGAAFPGCRIVAGYEQIMADGAAAIADDPALAGRTVMTLDIVNALWLLAGAPPQKGVALWPYAKIGAPLAQASLLAVPLCAGSLKLRNAILDEAVEAGMAPRIAARTRHWVIFDNAGDRRL